MFINWLLVMSFATIFGSIGLSPAKAQGSSLTDTHLTAQEFMDKFGVNVHFGDNNYRNTQAVADAIHIIGFRRIRGTCAGAYDVAVWKDIAARVAPYFPDGLKADVLVTGYNNVSVTTLAVQESAILQISGLIESIEGPNEINGYGVGNGTHGPFDLTDSTKNFPANYAAWAKALADWKRATPSLSHVALLAPSIASGDPADYARLPNVSQYVTSGNLHFYAGNGLQPSGFGGGNFSALVDWDRQAATPDKPVSVTEWGQTTASKPGQGGCDEATQAKYILNQICDVAAKGIYRAYLYQLMDDSSDGDPTGKSGSEAHFGIFDYLWRVKLAAKALANVNTLLADSSKPFQPKIPAYQVSGVTRAGASGSSLSLSKSDGSTMIVVWNEPPLWDAQVNAAIIPTPDKVTVSFGGRYSYRVYDPMLGLAPIAVGQATGTVIKLSGSPLFVQVQQSPANR